MEYNSALLSKAFEKEPVILLIGQSGCGKGTQQEMLINVYRELFPDANYLISETGQLFRDCIPGMSEWNRDKLQGILDQGRLQSPLIATALWMTNFLVSYKGGLVIADGTPRSVEEVAYIVSFYSGHAGKEIILFFFEVTDEEADGRMVARNNSIARAGKAIRLDCATPDARKAKMAFFHEHVLPAYRYAETVPEITTHSIDAMGTAGNTSRQIIDILERCHSQ
jgi:adenylate kinase family enzyme